MAKAQANPSARMTGYHDWPDEQIVQACLNDDAQAWRELVTRHSRLVYSIPFRYSIDEDTADDIFQDIFQVLLRQLPKLRDSRGLPKWLITATHRACWQWMRRSRLQSNGIPDLPDAGTPPLDQIIQWERQHEIRQAVRRLGGPCEALITALYLDEGKPSYAQIARRLGIPVGSIGPTRARCMQKLMAALKANA